MAAPIKYTEAEMEILRTLYPVAPKTVILKALNRSWDSICQAASANKIRRRPIKDKNEPTVKKQERQIVIKPFNSNGLVRMKISGKSSIWVKPGTTKEEVLKKYPNLI